MTSGLGPIQREILDALPESRAADSYHRGMSFYLGTTEPWHRARGLDVILAEGVGDLMVTRSVIAERRGVDPFNGWASPRFSESFSRAVRTLASRGEITILRLVPIIRYEIAPGAPSSRAQVHWLPDGMYLDYGARTARFARIGAS